MVLVQAILKKFAVILNVSTRSLELRCNANIAVFNFEPARWSLYQAILTDGDIESLSRPLNSGCNLILAVFNYEAAR
jgi:hypothetical protein